MIHQSTGENQGGSERRTPKATGYTSRTGEIPSSAPDRALEALRPAALSTATVTNRAAGTAAKEAPDTEIGKKKIYKALEDFASGFTDAAWGPTKTPAQNLINLGSIALGWALISKPMGVPGLLICAGGLCYGVVKVFQSAYAETNQARGVGQVIGGFIATGFLLGQARAIRNFAYRHHLLGASSD